MATKKKTNGSAKKKDVEKPVTLGGASTETETETEAPKKKESKKDETPKQHTLDGTNETTSVV